MQPWRYAFLLICTLTIGITACEKGKLPPPGNNNNNNNNGTDTNKLEATWQIAGEINAGSITAHASIATDTGGILYVVYRDGTNGNKASVMRLVDTVWEVVGQKGFSEGEIARASIAVDSATGTPYVTFVENSSAGSNRVKVMCYKNNQWSIVGATTFLSNFIATPSIALDANGTPYLAFVEIPAIGKVKVLDGSKWLDTFITTPGKKVFDIDIAAGATHFSYLYDSASVSNLHVLRHNDDRWENLNYPAQAPSSNSIVEKNGTPYIAVEGKRPSRVGSVMKFTGNWAYIGNQDFTVSTAQEPTIAVSNDSVNTPYVTFRDGNNMVYIMSYTTAGWTNVGIGFPKATATFVSLALNPVDDQPYVAITSDVDGSITILRYKKKYH